MVAIILVNWKNYDDTKDCLHSLYQSIHTSFSIIVVDNESQETPVAKLKKSFPQITVLPQKTNLGFTGANNIGIKYGLTLGAEYIMLLNNDTTVPKNFIDPLLMTLHSSPQIAAVQPKIMFHEYPDRIWNAGGIYYPYNAATKTIGYNKLDAKKYNESKYVDWITGCCILLKSEIITEVGLLNEHFFAYYEDVDWSLRIRKLGYRLAYNPTLPILHKVGASSKNKNKTDEGFLSPFVHFLNIRNHIFMARLHIKGIHVINAHIYLLLKIIIYGVYFMLKGRRKKLNMSFKGYLEGYSTQL
jgi:GT2 family glycosyltransferase